MDMTKLLGGQIGLDDFIFVHRKGNLNRYSLYSFYEGYELYSINNINIHTILYYMVLKVKLFVVY